MPAKQARYFLLTIPVHCFTIYLPPSCIYVKGQLERGASGYIHWQVLVVYHQKVTVTRVKETFGPQCHVELSRSDAANAYVWKEESRVGHQFELGQLPLKRNSKADWDTILKNAKNQKLDDIPADIVVRYYNSLKKIGVDSMTPDAQVKEVYVYWGTTGTGKSRKAWEEASWDAFPKDPNSKFWDGYHGQENVVVDEFRGAISISHMLRWLDRYPTIVEVKGSSVVFKAKRIWITSNLPPEMWYPDLDQETFSALKRRFTKVIHFNQL